MILSERSAEALLFPSFSEEIRPLQQTFYPLSLNGPSGAVTPLDLALYKKKVVASPGHVPFHILQTIPFLDYADENDNPVEDKYRTLAHDLLRGLVDPALKPDRVQRDQLAAIIASPSHHLSTGEKGTTTVLHVLIILRSGIRSTKLHVFRPSLEIPIQSCR